MMSPNLKEWVSDFWFSRVNRYSSSEFGPLSESIVDSNMSYCSSKALLLDWIIWEIGVSSIALSPELFCLGGLLT
jgi:hypothetical protein